MDVTMHMTSLLRNMNDDLFHLIVIVRNSLIQFMIFNGAPSTKNDMSRKRLAEDHTCHMHASRMKLFSFFLFYMYL